MHSIMENLTEIRYNSKWEVLTDFSIGIGSHSQNPNTTSLVVKKGEILKWEDDAPNGNVWFILERNGQTFRGKIESGAITNVIKSNRIKLLDNGNGFIAYKGEYLQRLLN